MKIVGKGKKDYYDCVSMMGVDETQVLVRNPQTIYLKDIHLDKLFIGCRYGYNEFEKVTLFFCGKIHTLYYSKGKLIGFDDMLPEEYKSKYCTTLDWIRNYQPTIPKLSDFEAIALKYKCPYFVVANVRTPTYGWELVLELYPLLRDYQFEKVVDPFTAYQEISSYYFNNLVTNNDNHDDIPDKYKIAKKGFDEVYGFRTRKHNN